LKTVRLEYCSELSSSRSRFNPATVEFPTRDETIIVDVVTNPSERLRQIIVELGQT
jgi:hypothetical protein